MANEGYDQDFEEEVARIEALTESEFEDECDAHNIDPTLSIEEATQGLVLERLRHKRGEN